MTGPQRRQATIEEPGQQHQLDPRTDGRTDGQTDRPKADKRLVGALVGVEWPGEPDGVTEGLDAVGPDEGPIEREHHEDADHGGDRDPKRSESAGPLVSPIANEAFWSMRLRPIAGRPKA